MGRISSVIESILREVRAFRNQRLYKKLFEPDRRELYSKLYLPDDEPRILSGPFGQSAAAWIGVPKTMRFGVID
jgi:hypothetical protein